MPSPARWSSPAASSRRPTAIRGCGRAAAAPTRSPAGELKFRVAGVREAFEECGILLARKRGQRAVIAAADLKGIEERWRAKLAKDEASIVDLVEAEDLELATDLMMPFAHWITPTFAPKRFDTWFFLAEAPEDQIALHDGSESVELGVDRRRSRRSTRPTAGRRTLVHATTKNLELLAEGGTVAGALSPGQRAQDRHRPALGRDSATASAILHIPPDAGYRNLVREMPPTAGGEVREGDAVPPQPCYGSGFRRPKASSAVLSAMIKCVSRAPVAR